MKQFVALFLVCFVSIAGASPADPKLKAWIDELDREFNEFTWREGKVTGQVNSEKGKLCDDSRSTIVELDDCLRKASNEYSKQADQTFKNFQSSRSRFKIQNQDLGRVQYTDKVMLSALRDYQKYEKKHDFMTYQEVLLNFKRSSDEQRFCETAMPPVSPEKATEAWLLSKCYLPAGLPIAERCDTYKGNLSLLEDCMSKGRQLIKDHVDNAIAASASRNLAKRLPEWEMKYGKASAPIAEESVADEFVGPIAVESSAPQKKKDKKVEDENRYRLFQQSIVGSAFSIRSGAAYRACNIGQAINDKNCVDCAGSFKESESDLSAADFSKLQSRPKWGSNFLDLLRYQAIQNRFHTYRLFGGTDFPIPQEGKVGLMCRNSASDFIAKLKSKPESEEDVQFKKSRTTPERLLDLANAASLLKANAERLKSLNEIPKEFCKTEDLDGGHRSHRRVCRDNPAYQALEKDGTFEKVKIAILETLSQFPELAIDRSSDSGLESEHTAADRVLKLVSFDVFDPAKDFTALSGKAEALTQFVREQNEKIKASAAKDLQDVCTPGKVSDEELLADDALYEQTLKNHPEYRAFSVCAKKIGDRAVTATSGGTSRNVRDYGCMGIAGLLDYGALVTAPVPLIAGPIAVAGLATGVMCIAIGKDDKENDYKRHSKAFAYLDQCLKRGGGSDCSQKEYLSRQESFQEAKNEFEDSKSFSGVAKTSLEVLLTATGGVLTLKSLWKGYKALTTGAKAKLFVTEFTELQNARRAALASGDQKRVKSIEEGMQVIKDELKFGKGAPSPEEVQAAWTDIQKEYLAGRYQGIKDLDEAKLVARAESETAAEKAIAANAEKSGGSATAYAPPEVTPKQIKAATKKYADVFKDFPNMNDAKQASLARAVETLKAHGLKDAEIRTFLMKKRKYLAKFAEQEEYATEIAYLVERRAAIEGLEGENAAKLLEREFEKACKLCGCSVRGAHGMFIEEPKGFDPTPKRPGEKYAEYRCTHDSRVQ